ncbi:SPW repeat domain-containing protein [Sabulicella glaciei]|uniref:SPW repeat protein n=1 Tax=Sabulicella glaciei TaxID=2984948 RepID=A0ABT3NUU4_9PROT|nr:SPW repeat protein [Roseococcus sp. MDT2-1-1]MCW8085920.1 SPW repeat protein [Roseococcus sp. MDT2-1-1]
MRVISTRTHGVLDYLTGLLLIAAPYIFGFADGTAAQYVPQILGVLLLGASLLTDYELGVMRMIPMSVHLTMDIAMGVLLAASPWLFGFADRVFWPHLLIGLCEIAAGFMTRTTPDTVADATLRNR